MFMQANLQMISMSATEEDLPGNEGRLWSFYAPPCLPQRVSFGIPTYDRVFIIGREANEACFQGRRPSERIIISR